MKLLKIALCLLMAVACVNLNYKDAYAIESAEVADVTSISEYGLDNIDYEADEYTSSSRSSRAKSASSDSSYTSTSTDVRDQGVWGTCWTFSTMGMAETYLLNNSNVTTDLSERQLAYFAYNSVGDPLGNTDDDSTTLVDTSTSYLEAGGNLYAAVFQLSGYCGAISETLAEYDSSNTMSDLDSSLAYESNSYVLENAYFLSNNVDSDTIKEMIVTYGAVSASYYHDTEDSSISTTTYLDEDNGAYYCPDDNDTNHAILIVGWDDDYDFSSTTLTEKPSSKGAWLIKQSWGEDFGNDGYMWLSYEDASLEGFVVATYVDADTYDYNYHYDGTTMTGSINITSGYSISNVYEVKGNDDGNETLEAVSFALDSAGVDYSIQIYTELEDVSDPTSGTAALSEEVTGSTTYSGIYTVDIDEEVELVNGSYYSVVITLDSDDETVSVFAEWDCETEVYAYEANVEENQSFYGYNGTWLDLADSGNGYCVRIKALTNDSTKTSTSISDAEITGIESSYDYTGSAIKPTPTVTLDGNELTLGTDYLVTYSNNTNAGTATVTVTGKGDYNGKVSTTFTINAIDISEASFSLSSESKIVITYNGFKLTLDTDYTASYTTTDDTITVDITGIGNFTGEITKTFSTKDIGLATITLSEDEFTYDGTEKEPEVTVVFDDTTLTQDTDYEISYSNNIDAGTATVTITGINNYSGSVTETFTIDPCSITSLSFKYTISTYTYDGTAKDSPYTPTYNDMNLVEGTDYTTEYDDNINVGTVTVYYTCMGNYTGSGYLTYTIEACNISKADITLSQNSYKYDGNAKTPDVTLTYNGFTLTEGTDYTLEYSDNTDVGTATITITGTGNFTGTATTTFTISEAALDITDALTLSGLETSYQYTGSAITPELTVKYGSTELIEGTDYSITYSDNTEIGTATITITATGDDYTGTYTTTFSIVQRDLSDATVTLTNDTYTYSGNSNVPVPTVTIDGNTLVEGTDYTYTHSNNVDAGTGTVSITGTGNYTGTITKDFTIEALSIESGTLTLSETSYSYDGEAKEPTVTFTYDGSELTLDTDYTVTYSDNTNAGTATVTVTGIGNYTGSVSSTFTISAISLEDASVTAGESFTYTGSAITPDITVTLDGTELALNTDYTVTYSDNTDVGTATLTITGTGNYTGTITRTFTITAREVSDDEVISLSAETFGYTGSAITPDVTVTVDGIELTLGTDYTVAYSDNTEVGTATITVTFMGNYTGTVTKTFTIIEIKELSSDHVTITFDDTDLTYTGSSIKPGVTVKYDGTVLAEDEDYTLSYSSDTINVGTVTVTIEGINAYDGTMTATYTITAKSISGATVKLKTTSFTYNGSSQSTSVSSVTLNGTTLSSSCYSVSGTSGTSAGTYTVTVTGKGNYTGTATATFTISKYTLTSSNISYTSSYTYKASAISPTITVKANSKTLTKGTDYTLSGTTSATAAGTYTFKVTGSGNFTGTVSKTFTISALSLANASPSISLTAPTYTGSALTPTPTVKVTVNGSTKTLTKGTDYTVSYSNNTNAGSSAVIKITGKGNYTGSVSGTFKIVQRAISAATVTLSSTSYTYNGSAKTPTITVKYNGKTLTKGTDYTVSGTTSATKAGTYTITIKGKGNFSGSTSKSFTINACAISKATASSISNKTYTGSAIKPTVTLKYNSKTLTKGTDYTVSYSSNKSTGKATITITGKNNFSGTKKVYFYIVPKKVTISSVKSSKTKTLTVKYKKATGASGYQIAYKKSGGSWKYKTVSSSTLSKTITGLTKKKKYSVKVRAYKTVSGTKYYGSWSTTKTVTTK